eukprot:1712266-Prymnesium_polylepis.1
MAALFLIWQGTRVISDAVGTTPGDTLTVIGVSRTTRAYVSAHCGALAPPCKQWTRLVTLRRSPCKP